MGAGPSAMFKTIYDTIIMPKCGACHGMPAGAGGLIMTDVDTAFTNLVGKPTASTSCGMLTRVVPGNPAMSLIVALIEFPMAQMNAPPLGAPMGCSRTNRMPRGAAAMPLSAGEITMIKNWIMMGAK